jgi:hypothetical protein
VKVEGCHSRVALPAQAAVGADLDRPERERRLAGNPAAQHHVIAAIEALAWDETRVRADAEPRLLQPRDDAEAGSAKDLPLLGALMPAVRTADLSCAEAGL